MVISTSPHQSSIRTRPFDEAVSGRKFKRTFIRVKENSQQRQQVYADTFYRLVCVNSRWCANLKVIHLIYNHAPAEDDDEVARHYLGLEWSKICAEHGVELIISKEYRLDGTEE